MQRHCEALQRFRELLEVTLGRSAQLLTWPTDSLAQAWPGRCCKTGKLNHWPAQQAVQLEWYHPLHIEFVLLKCGDRLAQHYRASNPTCFTRNSHETADSKPSCKAGQGKTSQLIAIHCNKRVNELLRGGILFTQI